MKYREPSIVFASTPDNNGVAHLLDGIHKKFMMQRKNTFDLLIEKYNKPVKSALIDLNSYTVVEDEDAAYNDSLQLSGKEASISMEVSREEQKELDEIVRRVKKMRRNKSQSFSDCHSFSFIGNSSNKNSNNKTLRTISVKRKRTIESLPRKSTDNRKSSNTKRNLFCNHFDDSMKKNKPSMEFKDQRKKRSHSESSQRQSRVDLQKSQSKKGTKNETSNTMTYAKNRSRTKSACAALCTEVKKRTCPIRQCALKSPYSCHSELVNDADSEDELHPVQLKKCRKAVIHSDDEFCEDSNEMLKRTSRYGTRSLRTRTKQQKFIKETENTVNLNSKKPLNTKTIVKSVNHHNEANLKHSSAYDEKISHLTKLYRLKECSVVIEKLPNPIPQSFVQLTNGQSFIDPQVPSNHSSKKLNIHRMKIEFATTRILNNDNVFVSDNSKSKKAKITVSWEYSKVGGFQPVPINKEQIPLQCKNFSFLDNMNETFVTLPNIRKSNEISELSLTNYENSYIPKLFNVHRWIK